ncbi:uncharacterized protein M6B38_168180 [Iris pallida]|uniref:Uncharacterized protein n=1 Tax=Iris pallida TaxID=29817 RepID=A0AAX6EWA6_IRIPA|nr:uncharacterized protein M6B38_168180 [Iris pallida]
MAAAAASFTKIPLFSSSLTSSPLPQFRKHNLSVPTPTKPFSLTHKLVIRTRRSFCCSSRADDDDQQAESSGADVSNDPFPSPDDTNYLLKLVAGSVGGGAVIKYGSILFPDITRPNMLQALLMVSLPVVVAVLILIKESRTENQSKDLF